MSDFSSRFRQQNMGKKPDYRYLMVTIFLLAVSLFTAAVSQVGKHLEKTDVLFFSSQKELDSARQDVILSNECDDIVAIMASLDHFKREQAKSQGLGAFRDIASGQIWRLFTPMFLHMTVWHIVFNMMWLWQFGCLLETRFGSWKFLALVLGISAAANVVQAWFVGSSFGGMSGVNYGLFGFLLLRSRLHPDPSYAIKRDTVALMLIWLIVCMLDVVGNVANHAHVGGFLFGGLLGAIHALKAGGWKLLRRRAQFKSSIRAADDAMYHCTVCGATEISHPERAFAVSRVDGNDYCDLHLPEDHK